MAISPVIYQIIIITSSLLAGFSVGGAVTYPTLLIEHFRSDDSDGPLDISTKSWIGSIYGFAGIPAVLMPIITQKIGRKRGYILACLCVMLGWILTYKATTVTGLLISESIHGLGTNSLLPVCYMAMSEMLVPKYRHVLMSTYGIGQGSGMAACGILGRYLHYKTVSLIMLAAIAAAIAIALMWPESPSWFACKGEFDKCERAFFKLRGAGDSSNIELQALVTAQKENLSHMGQEGMSLKTFWRKLSARDFYMPCCHMFLLFMMMYWSGCDVIYIYFIEMVTQSSNNEHAVFYASIVMYAIVLSGLICLQFLTTKFKYKTILTFSTCSVMVCLIVSSLVSGLQTLGVLSKDSLLLIYVLLLYIACASLGLNGLVFNMASELMPVKHRSLGGALYIVINCTLFASSLKFSAHISHYLGLWCTFLIYAINASVCMFFTWKYVPETKGKNMQEIEDYYAFGSFRRERCYVNESFHETNELFELNEMIDM